MKKIIFIFMFLTVPFILFAQTDYYYYKGEQIQLSINKQYVTIVTAHEVTETQIETVDVEPFTLFTESEMINGAFKKIAKVEFNTPISTQENYNQKVSELKSINGVEGVYPFYNYNEHSFGTSNKLIIKLRQIADTIHLQTFANQKNLVIINSLPDMPLWYKLSCTPTTIETPMELAALAYESDFFEAAEPAFTHSFIIPTINTETTPPSAPLDTCYDEANADLQWNLFNNPDTPLADINVCGAWEVTKGYNGVKVAVFDTGAVEGFPEFLVNENNVIQASSQPFNSNFLYGPHGTRVTSVLAAFHNGFRMGGIAPDVSLLHVAYPFDDPIFDQTEVAGGITACISNQVKVINMSFANSGPPSQVFADALDDALAEDIVLVAAVGNEATTGIGQPANYPGVLAIGGSDVFGDPVELFNHGPEMDLMAPGQDILTIHIDAETTNVGGTSYSAPHVSGTAALMFSAQQNLTADAVKNILRRTAQKSGEGSYIFGDLVHYEQDILEFSLGTKSNYTGYGIPDATACVLTAQEFETTAGVLDLHMRNSLQDFGKEPDMVTKHASNVLWNSPDIWVLNDDNGGFYEHQNPVYDGTESTTTVMVRVINKSNRATSFGEAKVKLYWSKLSYTSSWPDAWDGSTVINGVPVGGQIGDPNGMSVPAMDPGEQGLLFSFTWEVPNPDDFNGIFPNHDPNEFSFLARIIHEEDPMTTTEGISVWGNARNNNNIAWKNVVVIDQSTGSPSSSINICNFSEETKNYALEFKIEV